MDPSLPTELGGQKKNRKKQPQKKIPLGSEWIILLIGASCCFQLVLNAFHNPSNSW
jgi:hypothetical protein